jgi:hypothetical protein
MWRTGEGFDAYPRPLASLAFNNINRLALLQARANPICGHPYGLPTKRPEFRIARCVK